MANTEVRVTDQLQQKEDPGLAYDAGKVRYDLVPTRPLHQLAEVYGWGSTKYPANNWRKGISWSRRYASTLRHLFAWWRGENNDPESGLPHLAHAAWNIFTLLDFADSHPELDDRGENDA